MKGIFQIKYLYAEHVYGWGSEELSYYIFLAGGLRAVNLLFVMPFLISVFKSQPQETREATSSTVATESTTVAQPTAQQVKEMQFDLQLTRLSFAVDIISHTLVSFVAVDATARSQWMFVWFSVLSSLGSGVIPTVQSLALNIFKATGHGADEGRAGAGKLFGAIAALQAVFQMILGVRFSIPSHLCQ